MSEIIAAGDDEFTLGFRLAGVRNTIKADQDSIQNLLSRKFSGIVIIDQNAVSRLSEHTKEAVMNSVQPVFVSMSETGAADDLRAMIRKSIGIDIWDKQ